MSEFTQLEDPTTAKWNQKSQTVKTTAPSHSTAGRLWFDSTANAQKVRNAAASAEVLINKTAVTPSTQAFGDAAAVGTSAENARADHKHAIGSFIEPTIIGAADGEPGNGAFFNVAANLNDPQDAVVIRMVFNTEFAAFSTIVPPGATGVSSVDLHYFATSITGSTSIRSETKALAENEDPLDATPPPEQDTVTVTPTPAGSRLLDIVDIVGAFNATNLIQAGEILAILVVKAATELEIISLMSITINWS